MRVLIEARRAEYGSEWRIRSRMDEQNFKYREGAMTLEQLKTAAQNAVFAWQYIEPSTEFKVVLDHAYQERDRPVARPAPIDPEQAKLVRRDQATRRNNSRASGQQRSEFGRGSSNARRAENAGGIDAPDNPPDRNDSNFGL